jgi:hypothetical protein
MHDEGERERTPLEHQRGAEQRRFSSLRSGWKRPLVIIGILAVILVTFRVLLMLFTM